MNNPEGSASNRGRAFVLTSAVVVLMMAASTTWLLAQAPATQLAASAADRPQFDAASVKPNKSGDTQQRTQFLPGGRLTATNVPLRNLIATAYAPGQRRMIADPEWDRVLSERFDVEAKAEGNPTRDQTLLMLQSLLADRFELIAHFETRSIPTYALVLSNPGKTGPGLRPHSDDVKCIPVGPQQQGFGEFPTPWCGGVRVAPIPGGLRQIGNKTNMDVFITILMVNGVDRLVLDRTGLTGYFDCDWEFAFTQGQGAVPQPSLDASDPSAPVSIFTAMQEQLGLKLEPRIEPVYVLVVDHVEEPSEN